MSVCSPAPRASRARGCHGEESVENIGAAHNYANSLLDLKRFEEAKSLMRTTTPVARRVLGEGHSLTLLMRSSYAQVLYRDANASLEDYCEAATTLEDTDRIARRVFGGAHPVVKKIEIALRNARSMLQRAGETRKNN